MQGFERGFQLGGEHITAIAISAIYCIYPYYLGISGGVYHSNVFINCNEEHCIKSIYFANGISAGTLYEFISHDIEIMDSGKFARTSGAIEASPGSARGSVSYCTTTGGVGSSSINFWENGSGIQFKTRQAYDLTNGPTNNRPQHPSVNTEYFDTTINKKIYYTGTKWIDFMGNDV